MCPSKVSNVRLRPGVQALVLTGGAGSKGTINWPGTAHSGIYPRAKIRKFGGPRSYPPTPRGRLLEGQHPVEGAWFFIPL